MSQLRVLEVVTDYIRFRKLRGRQLWGIRGLTGLQHLTVQSQKLRRLPSGISTLTGLQTLLLQRCRDLRKLPDSIGVLANLQQLELFAF